MTVNKNFQCDVCFRSCPANGSSTIVLTRDAQDKGYDITSRAAGLNDVKPASDQMVRHICRNCVEITSGRMDLTKTVVKPPPWGHEINKGAKDNG